MSDILLDAADAIVTALNAMTPDPSLPTFTAARSLLPIVSLAASDAGSMQVTVVPVDDAAARDSALTRKDDILVRVFVQRKLPQFVDAATDEAACSALFAFAANIQASFLAGPLALDGKNAWAFKVDRKPACDMEMMAQREFFACIDSYWRSFG
jgi:hypothetical protein